MSLEQDDSYKVDTFGTTLNYTNSTLCEYWGFILLMGFALALRHIRFIKQHM